MQIIQLDISQILAEQPVLRAKQSDVGRKFLARITDNGADWPVPADAVVSVWYSGTAGQGNYTHIGSLPAAQISGNTLTVELIAQMLAAPGGGMLCLMLNGENGRQLGLWNLHYWVEPVPGADSGEAKAYYNAFAQNVAEAMAAAEKLTLPVPVQHGGTGAENAAAALANLGAAAAVHDHNGQSIKPDGIDVDAGHDWPRIYLRNKNRQDIQTLMQLDCTTKQFFFAVETPEGGFGEYYKLPALSATETAWYDILTTKNPVPLVSAVYYPTNDNELDAILLSEYAKMQDNSVRFIALNLVNTAVSSLSKDMWSIKIVRANSEYGYFEAGSYAGIGSYLKRTFNGGNLQPWEWEEPPMQLGVEYRTTERYEGQPVYTKLVACGKAVPGGSVSVTVDLGTRVLRYVADNGWSAMPMYTDETGGYEMLVRCVEPNRIIVRAGSQHTDASVYVQAWYLK